MINPKDQRISKSKSLESAKVESKKAVQHQKEALRKNGSLARREGQRIGDKSK